MKLQMSVRHKIEGPQPLCRIVNLLASKGDIDRDDVNDALDDYYDKHPDGLVDRVIDLYQPVLQSPGKAVAYWIRSVNPNAIKVATLCLEEQVSSSDPETVEAALITILNTLQLYRDSKSFLLQRQETPRGKDAIVKADKLYLLMRTAFLDNKDYLEKLSTSDHSYLETYLQDIKETLKQIEA